MAVDIASGVVRLEITDFSVPGKVDLIWDRSYSTANLGRPHSGLGSGWTNRYFSSLLHRREGYEFVTPEGTTEFFPDHDQSLSSGNTIRNLGAFLEIFRENHQTVVRRWNVESGDVVRYCFDTSALAITSKLVSIENVSGQGVDLDWNTDGRLTAITQRGDQRSLRISYNSHGLIDQVAFVGASDFLHVVNQYAYDNLGRLIESTNRTEHSDRYDYDDLGRLTREYIKDGAVFDYKYDSQGRCIRRSGLNGYDEKTLTYLDASRVTKVVDSGGNEYVYQHLPTGQCILEVDPLGGQRTTEYDEQGRIVAKTDANGAKNLCTFDEMGNRNSATDAMGNTTSFVFNQDHLPIKMTDALGQEWTRDYDKLGRLISATDPLGNTSVLRYDANGDITQLEGTASDMRRFSYTRSFLSSSTDWLSNVTRFEYDDFGNIIKREGPKGDVTTVEYDESNSPTRIVLPDGTSLRAIYDSIGNLLSVTNELGHVTKFRYGPCRRMLEKTDPLGRVVRYLWGNEPDALEQVVNEAGETYRFIRDEAGRVRSESSFDGAERHFSYCGEGNVIKFTNANGESVSIKRDPLSRITRQQTSDGEVAEFTYDALGNIVTAETNGWMVTFKRDGLGRVLQETQGKHWVKNTYGVTGSLLSTSTSLEHTIDFENDANGLLAALSTLGQTTSFTRNADGQESTRQISSNTVLEHDYDLTGRLIEQRVGPGRTVQNALSIVPKERAVVRRQYSYSRIGLLASIKDDSWGNVDFAYDPAEQLLEVLRQKGASENFAYDATGNLVQMRGDGKDETLVYGPGNRLEQHGNTRFVYDLEGRRIQRIDNADSDDPQVWKYEWNALDQLKSVQRPDDQVWEYRYDALSRRVEKSNGRSTRQYVWSEDVIIHELTDNKTLSTWIFDGDSFAPLATIQNSRMYSVVTDQLGTPRELIDQYGTVAWSMTMNAWGSASQISTTENFNVECSIRFQGQWYDSETELHYNRYRYLDPHRGQFISADPIGLAGGTNLQRYAPNPINWVDPLGLNPVCRMTGTRVTNATDLPIVRPGTPAWNRAVSAVRAGGRGDIRVANRQDAAALLQQARGNMDRRKNYTPDSYAKGYEVHHAQSPVSRGRETAVGNDLAHVKWKDNSDKSGGHIFFGDPW